MPRIQLRVSEEQKEAWEEYAESHPNTRSVSELIRLAVTREMADEPQGTTDLQGMDELRQTVENTDEKVEQLVSTLDIFIRGLNVNPRYTEPASVGDETDVSAFISELREGRENAQSVEDKSMRKALRELADDIRAIRETDDGEFYLGDANE